LRAADAAVRERPAGDAAAPAAPAEPKRPASLLERWRRYTETIN
jgi:hypothetical protein